MASAEDLYLPDVAKVFAGEASTFSWDEAFQLLRKNRFASESIAYQVLSSSIQAKNVLSQKVPLFSPASQQSKTGFETRTSAVNVAPATESSYDIDQIKKDVLWLSAEVKIAEEEALRITILEWERRPRQRLLAGYSEVEQASLRDAFGGQKEVNEDFSFNFPGRSDDDFDSELFRRRRILRQYAQEQAAAIGIARELQQIAMTQNLDTRSHEMLSELALDVDQTKTTDAGFKAILDNIDHRLQSINEGRSWTSNGAAVEDIWLASEFQIIQQHLQVFLLRLRSSPQLTIAGEVVLQWLRIAAGCEFFSLLSPNECMPLELVQHLQATAAILSVALLDPASTVAALSSADTTSNADLFFLNTQITTEITHILTAASENGVSQAAPASLTWALILEELRRSAAAAKESREQKEPAPSHEPPSNRRTSYGSLQQSIYEDVVDHVQAASPVSDVIAYLLRCSIEINHALDVLSSLARFQHQTSGLLTAVKLQVLQEVVTVCVSVLGYNADVLETQLALLEAPFVHEKIPDIRDTFVKNDFLMDSIFAVAAGRFPYETVPFLRLCRLLSSAQIFDENGTNYIAYRLREMETFTQLAVGSFADYHTVREDENLNLVALDKPANAVTELSLSTTLSERTVGEVISDSVPPIIRWRHAYSALGLMGTWLESYRSGSLQNSQSLNDDAAAIVTEIIGLLYSLLRNTIEQPEGAMNMQHQQDELLADFSSCIQSDLDITDCLFDIMEQELHHFRRKPSNTFNTGILVACVEFMSVLVRVKPQKFWALFSRTTLLESFGSDSILLSLVTGVEVVGQDFPLLFSCCRLYKEMITAALPAHTAKSASYHPQTVKIQASLLLSLTQTLFITYDQTPGWSFTSATQMSSITSSLSESFIALTVYAYGFGEEASVLRRPFLPAIRFVESQLKDGARGGTGLTALFRHILRMTELGNQQWLSTYIESKDLAFLPIIRLAHHFVRLGRLRNHEPASFELQLFNGMPILLRVLSGNVFTLSPICKLLQELLETVQTIKPVSLLGHLGSVSSISLVETLKTLQAFSVVHTRTDIWALLACLVSQHQQWLALVLLTGSAPETGRSDTNKAPTRKLANLRGQSLMDTAIDLLLQIADTAPQVTMKVLRFIIQGQQNWSSISTTPGLKNKLLPILVSYVTDTFVDKSSPLSVSYKNKISSLVTDFATTYLHHAKVLQEKESIRIILSLLFHFGETPDCVDVGSYNLSLHANLKRNFTSKYQSLDVKDFQRTKLIQTSFGDDFYYGIEYLQSIIGTRMQTGSSKGGHGHSFIAEFQRANVNLSLVESEIDLLRSVKLFCTQHSGFLVQNGPHTNVVRPQDLFSAKEIYDALTKIIMNCLSANSIPYPSQEIFEALFESRADLTIALLQRLVDAKAKGFDVKGLLNKTWDCAQFRNKSYDEAIMNNDLTYWRTTLTSVLLAMQFHCGGKWTPPVFNHEPADMLRQELTNITPTILELMHVVVGRGFRTVATAIQRRQKSSSDSPGLSTPSLKDLLLNLSLLNTMLRLTRSAEYISEVSNRLVTSEIVESCLLLYSWSHTLRDPEYDSEPVYADICLQYLGSLSSLPPVAEYLGIEGVLSRLLNAQITQKLRNIPEGAQPLDKRQDVRFMYNIWVSGFLPLCLNLLHSIGAPVAAEVSVFLNQFPEQLNLASSAFILAAQSKAGGNGSITLIAAREAAMLSLISYILDSYRQAGASAAVDSSMILPLAGYDEHKKALAEDISELDNNGIKDRVLAVTSEEIEWSRIKEGDLSKLDIKVLHHLKNAAICLKGQNSEGDGS